MCTAEGTSRPELVLHQLQPPCSQDTCSCVLWHSTCNSVPIFAVLCSSLYGEFWKRDGSSYSCLWSHPVKSPNCVPKEAQSEFPSSYMKVWRDKTIKGMPKLR